MKKMTTIIFAFLLLFQCSTVYGKGTLYDKDSFSTYTGLSKNQVKAIAPYFQEIDEDNYLLDLIAENNTIYSLCVDFDENDIVKTVFMMIAFNGTIDEDEIFRKSLEFLGIDYYKSGSTYDMIKLEGFKTVKTDDYFCTGSNSEDDANFDNIYTSICGAGDDYYSEVMGKVLLYAIFSSAISTSEEDESTIDAQINEDGTWTCENGHSGNRDNFCTQCGAPKPVIPENDGTWTCENGHTGNTDNFCTKCGAPKPAQNNTDNISSIVEQMPTQEEIDEMFKKGIAYDTGDGVKKDPAQAAYWYQKAAELGHVTAAFNLGVSYDNGDGVEQDYEKAVYWYRKAAEKGYANAQLNLGYAYHYGEGVDQDYDQAKYWYEKAAEQGNEKAKKNLDILLQKIQSSQSTATPKPTMAPLPTATPEPTENDSLGDYRFEINNPYDIGTVMRKKPKISGEVVCTVKNGTHVRIIGDTTNADGFTWREIQTENGLTGFVNDAHIK